VGGQIDFEPYQQAAARFPQISAEQFQESIHLIEPDRRVFTGAEAVLRMLATAGHKRWLHAIYSHVPAAGALFDSLYGFVARHRGAMNSLDLVLLGRNTEPVTYWRTRAMFLRLLGVIYLIAFLSLAVQIQPLIGTPVPSPIA